MVLPCLATANDNHQSRVHILLSKDNNISKRNWIKTIYYFRWEIDWIELGGMHTYRPLPCLLMLECFSGVVSYLCGRFVVIMLYFLTLPEEKAYNNK